MRFLFAGFIVLYCFFSCSDKKNNEKEISEIQVDFSVKRYEVDFYNATYETLPKVKQKYPYLFPNEFTDSLAFAKINDQQEQELFRETSTLSVKLDDPAHKSKALDMKLLVEEMREQAQNAE